MSRERFLELLQFFDNNYNFITNGDSSTDDYLKENKEALERWKKNRNIQMISRIDILKVKHLTLTGENVDKSEKIYNCFTPFYKLEEIDLVTIFFPELSTIELGLNYFDDFAAKYRDIKSENRNQSKQKKISEVMDMLVAGRSNYETTIEELKNLHDGLNNRHFTERQLFQHLLYTVAHLLNDGKNGHTVAKVTNKLIEDYFESDITFSRSENIDNYRAFTYYYTDAKGITLHHAE